MTPYEQFKAQLDAGLQLTGIEDVRISDICARVRGYSDRPHYAFFKALLALPSVRDVLILGVYHGRDIAFMRDALNEAGRRDVWITGVDKFSDTPCADWPASSLGKGWQDAGFGPPPSLAQAIRNVGSSYVQLLAMKDEDFLAMTDRQFDAVYFDTSHDYATVRRQCQQVARVCRGDAIICGDDYSDESNKPGGVWGVKRAVTECFQSHIVYLDWIWASSRNLLKL